MGNHRFIYMLKVLIVAVGLHDGGEGRRRLRHLLARLLGDFLQKMIISVILFLNIIHFTIKIHKKSDTCYFHKHQIMQVRYVTIIIKLYWSLFLNNYSFPCTCVNLNEFNHNHDLCKSEQLKKNSFSHYTTQLISSFNPMHWTKIIKN